MHNFQQFSKNKFATPLDKLPPGGIYYTYPKTKVVITIPQNCCKTKIRGEDEYKRLINRLSRIEGQVRGIRRMVEKDAYCPDILIQVAAVSASLGSFNKELLANHIRTCVADDIREGKNETVEELVNTIGKLMR